MNHDLVEVKESKLNVLIDLKYSSSDNFTKKKILSNQICLIHKIAYEHLELAANIAEKLSFTLKIFDAYRPVFVQNKLWEYYPDPNFIVPPSKGSPHSRGIAIDLTLTNFNGEQLDMGTDFDEFSKLSYHGNLDISEKAYKNRMILLGIMTDAGWDFFRNEWWHYQLFNSKKYPIIDNFENQ